MFLGKMDTYSTLKAEILKINQDILSLFAAVKSMPGVSDDSFSAWEKSCVSLPGQMSEDVIRVAVVGPIKSGKSTLLNSMLRGDYLKRGAGVVTSIVTRVRTGQRLRAKLFFKSWDEVNADMEQALVLFPSLDWRSDRVKFDIRRTDERHQLQQALKSLSTEQLISQDTRNINNVLLTSYLKGYDCLDKIYSPENSTRQYEDDNFAEHRAFVGTEELAVYLKDVKLEIPTRSLERNIEVADCQGSDSSNPMHMAMIQDYLLLTHLIVYVVSSRTGLRQADIRFLSMIKKMGILDNILFVINCDFSEHESIDDLKSLIARVQEELALIKPEPEVYTFSALYNLFSHSNIDFSEKDWLRFLQWKAEKELVDFSAEQTARFESVLQHTLKRKRDSLLLRNHLERLGVILSGTVNWIDINQEILAKDTQSAQEIIQKLKQHQERLSQIKSVLSTTISGAVSKIQQKLSSDANRFFDLHSSDIIKDIFEFVKNYKVSTLNEKKADLSSITKAMYVAFQDFKQSLDSFITEVINPEVIRFIKIKENEISDFFETILRPYETMLSEVYAEYNRLLKRFGVIVNLKSHPNVGVTDINALIQKTDLKPPTIVAAMHYTAGIKTATIMRLGFYSLQRNFKKLLKKPVNERAEIVHLALKGGVKQMKRETLKSIVYQLKDYRENLKFKFLLKLVTATAISLTDVMFERFQIFFTDLSAIGERLTSTQVDKERASEILQKMDKLSHEIEGKIERMRKKIELTV